MEKMRNPQNDIDSSESLKTVSMHFLFRTNLTRKCILCSCLVSPVLL